MSFKLAKSNYKKLLPHSKQAPVVNKLPKMCFVDNGIIRTQNNTLFGTLKIQGVNVATASNSDINDFDNLFHNLVTSLDDSYGIIGHVVRRKMPTEFGVKGKSQFTKEFNIKYLKQFKDAKLYSNDIYLTIYHRKLTHILKNKTGKIFSAFSSLVTKALYGNVTKDAIDIDIAKSTKELKEVLERFRNQLGNADSKHLSTGQKFYATILDYKNASEDSQMMSFLSSFVNGLDNVNFTKPTEKMYDSKDLAAKGIGDTILGIPSYSKFPYGNVAEYLTNQDIPFGEKRYFRFENNNKIANMISIRRYAKYLTALSLHDLFMVDAEMIYTVSFLPIERSEARKKVKKVVTAMNVTNDAGDSEMINLENLEDDILSENITLGASHVSLMVLAPNKEDLIEKTNQIQRIFGENDFQTLVEQYNHDGAFWAQFPANFQYIARSRLISSDVFCHFFPMQNFPTGHNYRTHLGEALCLVKTPSMTPMYFNFHAKGSGKSTDIKAGHLPIIGANGFGKTTFMLMMESLMEKYDIRSFIFDKNNGTEIYVEASKGKYINYDYSDDVEGIKHNPFALDDTLANREFVSRFICSMVRRKDEGYVPAKVANQIKECVDYAYNHIPKDQRRLSTAVNIGLEHNFERMDELQQFLRSDGIRADGKYAIFFDNQVESFDFNAYSKFGLDTTKLLKDPKLTGLVSYYIFTLIRMSIESVKAGQTQLTGIFIDEVADKLSDPYFSAEIDESLPILRKQNAFVVIGMQSASTLTDYENRAIILDNSATMIIAPNPTADYEVYKKLNISNAEFNWVKRTPVESRQALYKQPMTHDTAIIDLSLKGFERQLSVISGSTASVNLKRQIIKDLGTNDPDVWLPEFYKQMGV